MKHRKMLLIAVFVLFALPIPLSMVTWIGTIISVADIGMTDTSTFSEWIQTIVALITMLLAGTYLITYIVALVLSWKKQKLTVLSFLPLMHIALFGICLSVWMWLNSVYKV